MLNSFVSIFLTHTTMTCPYCPLFHHLYRDCRSFFKRSVRAPCRSLEKEHTEERNRNNPPDGTTPQNTPENETEGTPSHRVPPTCGFFHDTQKHQLLRFLFPERTPAPQPNQNISVLTSGHAHGDPDKQLGKTNTTGTRPAQNPTLRRKKPIVV